MAIFAIKYETLSRFHKTGTNKKKTQDFDMMNTIIYFLMYFEIIYCERP